ncbi:MAG: hypothetical protein HC796_01385 [Synechococcaceae cyanobacterium RL_1_2]|nr:hypothetical protein [Synechococcaceae cyanobacterium RL_1_2]
MVSQLKYISCSPLILGTLAIVAIADAALASGQSPHSVATSPDPAWIALNQENINVGAQPTAPFSNTSNPLANDPQWVTMEQSSEETSAPSVSLGVRDLNEQRLTTLNSEVTDKLSANVAQAKDDLAIANQAITPSQPPLAIDRTTKCRGQRRW